MRDNLIRSLLCSAAGSQQGCKFADQLQTASLVSRKAKTKWQMFIAEIAVLLPSRQTWFAEFAAYR
jgi:hypothetical protein